MKVKIFQWREVNNLGLIRNFLITRLLAYCHASIFFIADHTSQSFAILLDLFCFYHFVTSCWQCLLSLLNFRFTRKQALESSKNRYVFEAEVKPLKKRKDVTNEK